MEEEAIALSRDELIDRVLEEAPEDRRPRLRELIEDEGVPPQEAPMVLEMELGESDGDIVEVND